MPWNESYISKLEAHLAVKFPEMSSSYARSEAIMSRLSEILGSALPDEASFVVFGSLARKEYTSGSDLDWSLVIDGRADAEHRTLELDLKRRIKESDEFKNPSPTGAFGALVFGHELIHCIGGLADTNANLTRRLLLLLESAELVGMRSISPRQQLMRGILQRYFEEEANFPGKPFFPRFFLNDIVRLWRTIAVDYAAKNSERGHEKWALRNAKLRFSRKLLYIAGLLLTYETSLFQNSDLSPEQPLEFDSENPQFSSTEHCYRAAQLTPLELLARACLDPGLAIERKDVKRLFLAYDRFLGMLDSEIKREELARLSYEEAMSKTLFKEMRDLGHEFQEAIDGLFLNPATLLGELTRRYVTF